MTTDPIPDRPASHWLRVGPRLLAACKAALERLDYRIGAQDATSDTLVNQLRAAVSDAERTGP